MYTVLFIWIALMVVCGVIAYLYYNKRKQAMADINLSDEKKNFAAYKTELENGRYSYLNAWMDGKPVDAFTSASFPLKAGDYASALAKDAAKSLAWAAVGVKAKYRRVETPSFLVLSGKNLHFLTTNVDGDLDKNIVLGSEVLNNATLEFKGHLNENAINKKMMSELDPNYYNLNVEINGTPQIIRVHDMLSLNGDLATMVPAKAVKMSIQNKVVGEKLIEKLMAEYPNLKSSAN